MLHILKNLFEVWFYKHFNVFIYVYSPKAGADKPLGTSFWCQQKGFITLPICCKFPKHLFDPASDFIHTFNDFIHVYSPKAGKDNPLRTKLWCQQKGLIPLPICCKFQKHLFEHVEVWFYTFFHAFIHVYNALSLCPFVASFKKKFFEVYFLQIFFHASIHVIEPRGKGRQPLGVKVIYQHKPFVTLVICCKFLPLNDFLTFFLMKCIFSHIKRIRMQICPCRKKGQGQSKFIIWTNYVGPRVPDAAC